MSLVMESSMPPADGDAQVAHIFITPEVATELSETVASMYPDADSIVSATKAVWQRHLLETEILPDSRFARTVDSLGKVASWPLHAIGLHDTPRWQVDEARKNSARNQAWTNAPYKPADQPTSWDTLGVAIGPFKEAYFASNRPLTTSAVRDTYNEVTEWLRKREPTTREKLLDKLEVLEDTGVTVLLDQLIETPDAVKARGRSYEELNGEFQRGLEELVRYGIRPPITDQIHGERQNQYEEAVASLRTEGLEAIGGLALEYLREDPEDGLDIIRATADVSLEVKGDKPSGLTESEAHIIADINELLTPAKLALASKRFAKDYQKEEISKFGALICSGALTGLGLTAVQKYTQVKDVVIQFLAGGLDDITSLGGLIRDYWHNIKDIPKEVVVPAIASAATVGPLLFFSKAISGLAASRDILAHIEAGSLFESVALGIATAGSLALAYVRGSKLRKRAEQNLTHDFITGVDPQTIDKLRHPKRIDLELAKSIVEKHIDTRIEFADMNENDLLKLRAAGTTKDVKKLVTPSKLPGLAYANKAFHDAELQPLFSRSQIIAFMSGVGLFTIDPDMAKIPMALAMIGSFEGLITAPLYAIQEWLPKIAFTMRRTTNRTAQTVRNWFHRAETV